MGADTALAHLDTARQALAEARTVDEVKDIRDQAEAMRQYAKRAGMAKEAVNHAAAIKLLAERRGGELLPSVIQRGGDARLRDETLLNLGISKPQSHYWQLLALVPEEAFERYLAGVRAAGDELTSVAAYEYARRFKLGPAVADGEEVAQAGERSLAEAPLPGPAAPLKTYTALIPGECPHCQQELTLQVQYLPFSDEFRAFFVPADKVEQDWFPDEEQA